MVLNRDVKRATRELKGALEIQNLFLREMYLLFNLSKPPESLPVHFVNSDIMGARLVRDAKNHRFKISIPTSPDYASRAFEFGEGFEGEFWKEYLATREYLAAHELGHYLRIVANPISNAVSHWDDFYEFPQLPKDDKNFHFGHFLEEIIAEMSAIHFMDRLGRFNRTSFWAASYPFFAPAYKILREKGERAIGELSSLGVDRAIEVIKPYAHLAKQEPLVSREESERLFVIVERAAA